MIDYDDDGPDMLNDMPRPDPELEELGRKVVDCCYTVHVELGPGLPESHYENALAIEFTLRNIPFERQAPITVEYKGQVIGSCRVDFIIDKRLILEVKAVDALAPIHKAQTLTYIKIMNHRIGFVVNFSVERFKQGMRRIINPYYKP